MGKKMYELIRAWLLTVAGLAILFLIANRLVGSSRNRTSEQESLQKDLMTGERVVYLFDSASGTCVHAWKGVGGYDHTFNWVVSCATVKDKLIPMNPDWAPIYLFDPISGICVIGYSVRNETIKFWPVSCANIKDKFDPATRKQLEAIYGSFLAPRFEVRYLAWDWNLSEWQSWSRELDSFWTVLMPAAILDF